MYNLTSPGGQRPVYDRGGMRLDLAITDPSDYEGSTQKRFELSDTFRAQQGRDTHNYHFGVMFPDEFQETPDRFLVQQFKHGSPTEDHSPPVSLKVENDEVFWVFRTVPKGYDPKEEESGRMKIIRNRWYDFDLTVRWSSKHSQHPFFRASCNGQLIVERQNTINCYDIAGGLRMKLGLYVWDWDNLDTQTIYARL